MTEQREPYLLLSDGAEESERAEELLKKNGVKYSVQIAVQSDPGQFRYPRLVTPEGSLIGLPHIRLFFRPSPEDSPAPQQQFDY